MKQVTAAVIVENGRLFVARRPPGDPLAGLWELPGGKIEAGETPRECLERELMEELAMSAEASDLLATTVYHYDHGSFEMLALQTRRLSEFALLVHDQFAWITRADLELYRLAPADVVLVDALVDRGVLA